MSVWVYGCMGIWWSVCLTCMYLSSISPCSEQLRAAIGEAACKYYEAERKDTHLMVIDSLCLICTQPS